MGIEGYFLSAIFQLILFYLVPLITYLITRKKLKGFFSYIGLTITKIKNWKKFILPSVLLQVLLLLNLVIIYHTEDFSNIDSISTSFATNNITIYTFIISLFMFAFIQTGLSEEILFRGFIAKRLVNKFGFLYENIMESLSFGSLHFFSLKGGTFTNKILLVI